MQELYHVIVQRQSGSEGPSHWGARSHYILADSWNVSAAFRSRAPFDGDSPRAHPLHLVSAANGSPTACRQLRKVPTPQVIIVERRSRKFQLCGPWKETLESNMAMPAHSADSEDEKLSVSPRAQNSVLYSWSAERQKTFTSV